jgi:putative membrane protein
MMTRFHRKFLWIIFISTIFVFLIEAVRHLFQWGLVDEPAFSSLRYTLAAFLLLVHATWVFDLKRGLCFILIASLMGFLAEAIGLHHFALFGGRYVYHGDSLRLLGVPLAVPIFWAILIYLGYSLTSSFLYWLHKDKPSRHTGGAVILPLLVLLDGLIVVSIDMLVDPLHVYEQKWSWLDGGSYYGVPIGNFMGWFLVAAVSTGLFRILEYFWPRQKNTFDKWIHLMPNLCYGVFCFTLVSWALRIQMPELALIGFLAMGPVLIANLILFAYWRPAINNAKQ